MDGTPKIKTAAKQHRNKHGKQANISNGSIKTSRQKPKGDGGKGMTKKMSRQFAITVTTIYDILRQVATFSENFRRFVPLT